MKAEPRQLLKAIPGIEFVEVEGADQCCGSAGIYNIVQNDLSMAILDAKMEQIRKAGWTSSPPVTPAVCSSSDTVPAARDLNLEVVHPVELLARALRLTYT